MGNNIGIIPYLFALITVTITATAQTLLKYGVNVLNLQDSISTDVEISLLSKISFLVFNPFILGGIGLYGVSSLLWIYVLSRLPLSRAYPFVGLSIVITSIVGALFLGERLVVTQIIGIVLVSIGVFLVACV